MEKGISSTTTSVQHPLGLWEFLSEARHKMDKNQWSHRCDKFISRKCEMSILNDPIQIKSMQNSLIM